MLKEFHLVKEDSNSSLGTKRRAYCITKMLKNKFYIGVMSPDGSGERLLAQGYLVEGPTWAPNGRVLMYLNKKLLLTMGKVLRKSIQN